MCTVLLVRCTIQKGDKIDGGRAKTQSTVNTGASGRLWEERKPRRSPALPPPIRNRFVRCVHIALYAGHLATNLSTHEAMQESSFFT